MSDETNWRAVHRLEAAADKMAAAADRVEEAARRLAGMFEDGYGGYGVRLVEQMEKAEAKAAELPSTVSAVIDASLAPTGWCIRRNTQGAGIFVSGPNGVLKLVGKYHALHEFLDELVIEATKGGGL